MFHRMMFILSIFLSGGGLYSAPALPHEINFETLQGTAAKFEHFEYRSWVTGYSAFNYAPELTPLFAQLAREHRVNVAVETGTFFGGTTVVLSSLFNRVHTIEIVPTTYSAAKKRLEKFENVQCHLGNSNEVLEKLLPNLTEERLLFYLDAHWENYWPLLQELEEIAKTHRDHCIIVIDDFKVPNRPDIPYDKYGRNECSYEYIKERLNLVFSDYTTHYILPRNKISRAKFIAIPKTWR